MIKTHKKTGLRVIASLTLFFFAWQTLAWSSPSGLLEVCHRQILTENSTLTSILEEMATGHQKPVAQLEEDLSAEAVWRGQVRAILSQWPEEYLRQAVTLLSENVHRMESMRGLSSQMRLGKIKKELSVIGHLPQASDLETLVVLLSNRFYSEKNPVKLATRPRVRSSVRISEKRNPKIIILLLGGIITLGFWFLASKSSAEPLPQDQPARQAAIQRRIDAIQREADEAMRQKFKITQRRAREDREVQEAQSPEGLRRAQIERLVGEAVDRYHEIKKSKKESEKPTALQVPSVTSSRTSDIETANRESRQLASRLDAQWDAYQKASDDAIRSFQATWLKRAFMLAAGLCAWALGLFVAQKKKVSSTALRTQRKTAARSRRVLQLSLSTRILQALRLEVQHQRNDTNWTRMAWMIGFAVVFLIFTRIFPHISFHLTRQRFPSMSTISVILAVIALAALWRDVQNKNRERALRQSIAPLEKKFIWYYRRLNRMNSKTRPAVRDRQRLKTEKAQTDVVNADRALMDERLKALEDEISRFREAVSALGAEILDRGFELDRVIQFFEKIPEDSTTRVEVPEDIQTTFQELERSFQDTSLENQLTALHRQSENLKRRLFRESQSISEELKIHCGLVCRFLSDQRLRSQFQAIEHQSLQYLETRVKTLRNPLTHFLTSLDQITSERERMGNEASMRKKLKNARAAFETIKELFLENQAKPVATRASDLANRADMIPHGSDLDGVPAPNGVPASGDTPNPGGNGDATLRDRLNAGRRAAGARRRQLGEKLAGASGTIRDGALDTFEIKPDEKGSGGSAGILSEVNVGPINDLIGEADNLHQQGKINEALDVMRRAEKQLKLFEGMSEMTLAIVMPVLTQVRLRLVQWDVERQLKELSERQIELGKKREALEKRRDELQESTDETAIDAFVRNEGILLRKEAEADEALLTLTKGEVLKQLLGEQARTIQELGAALRTQQQANTTMAAELEKKTADVRELETQVGDWKDRAERSEEALERLRRGSTETGTQVEGLLREVERLRSELETRTTERDQSQAALRELTARSQGELAEQGRRIEQLETLRGELEARVSELETQVAAQERAYAALLAEKQRLETQIAELERAQPDAAAQAREIADLHAALDETGTLWVTRFAEAELRHTELSVQLGEAQVTISSLRETVERLEAEQREQVAAQQDLEMLRGQVEAARAEFDRLTSENNSLSSELERTRTEITEEGDRLAELRRQAAEIQADEARAVAIRLEIEQLETRRTQLNGELEGVNRQLETARADFAEAEATLEAARQVATTEIEPLLRAASEMTGETFPDTLERAKNLIAILVRNYQSLEALRASFASEADALRTQVREHEKQAGLLRAEIARLRAQVPSARTAAAPAASTAVAAPIPAPEPSEVPQTSYRIFEWSNGAVETRKSLTGEISKDMKWTVVRDGKVVGWVEFAASASEPSWVVRKYEKDELVCYDSHAQGDFFNLNQYFLFERHAPGGVKSLGGHQRRSAMQLLLEDQHDLVLRRTSQTEGLKALVTAAERRLFQLKSEDNFGKFKTACETFITDLEHHPLRALLVSRLQENLTNDNSSTRQYALNTLYEEFKHAIFFPEQSVNHPQVSQIFHFDNLHVLFLSNFTIETTDQEVLTATLLPLTEVQPASVATRTPARGVTAATARASAEPVSPMRRLARLTVIQVQDPDTLRKRFEENETLNAEGGFPHQVTWLDIQQRVEELRGEVLSLDPQDEMKVTESGIDGKQTHRIFYDSGQRAWYLARKNKENTETVTRLFTSVRSEKQRLDGLMVTLEELQVSVNRRMGPYIHDGKMKLTDYLWFQSHGEPKKGSSRGMLVQRGNQLTPVWEPYPGIYIYSHVADETEPIVYLENLFRNPMVLTWRVRLSAEETHLTKDEIAGLQNGVANPPLPFQLIFTPAKVNLWKITRSGRDIRYASVAECAYTQIWPQDLLERWNASADFDTPSGGNGRTGSGNGNAPSGKSGWDWRHPFRGLGGSVASALGSASLATLVSKLLFAADREVVQAHPVLEAIVFVGVLTLSSVALTTWRRSLRAKKYQKEISVEVAPEETPAIIPQIPLKLYYLVNADEALIIPQAGRSLRYYNEDTRQQLLQHSMDTLKTQLHRYLPDLSVEVHVELFDSDLEGSAREGIDRLMAHGARPSDILVVEGVNQISPELQLQKLSRWQARGILSQHVQWVLTPSVEKIYEQLQNQQAVEFIDIPSAFLALAQRYLSEEKGMPIPVSLLDALGIRISGNVILPRAIPNNIAQQVLEDQRLRDFLKAA